MPSHITFGIRDDIDDDAEYVWIIGGVEEPEDDDRNSDIKPRFFIEIVPNRRSNTIKNLFYRTIKPDTTIITDGLSSYPAAISQANGERGMNYQHFTMNHSEEFIRYRSTYK